MVDVDNATHGLTLLHLNEVNRHMEVTTDDGATPVGLFDGQTFSHERDVVTLPNQVGLVPATFDFRIDAAPPDFDLQDALRAVIAFARSSDYGYVFLDAQAGADSYSRIAMSKNICDKVIIVTEYDPLSAAGVERLKAIMQDDLGYARTWVLVNKMLPDFADSYSDFLEVVRYLSPIPWDADVVRAYAKRSLPLELNYGNSFTLAVMQTLKRLLGSELAGRIDAWAKGTRVADSETHRRTIQGSGRRA